MTKTTEKYTAFGFGVFFVVVMLAIALFRPNPTPFEQKIYGAVLALAGGGVAAMIPGFLTVSVSKWLRAGGGLAVFAVLYFYNPASLVARPTPPCEAAVTMQAGTYDAAELMGILGSATGGVVIDQKLATRIQGRRVTLSSPWNGVVLKVALEQWADQLGVAVVCETKNGTVVVREMEQ